MPLHFSTFETYSIDYNKLYEELMKRNFLNNFDLQNEYVKLWLSRLKRQDEIETAQIKDSVFRSLLLKEHNEAPEKYMLEINFNTEKINVFFRVSRLLQAMGSVSKDMIVYVDADDFIMNNSYIKWCETPLLKEVIETPILLAPLTIDEYVKYVVIDGNHRVSAWIKNKQEKIPCCFLDGQALVDNDMFCSIFNKLMYIFQNEIIALGTYVLRDNIDARTLMNKIYFKTGKFLYDV